MELACDKAVLKGKDKGQCVEYGSILLSAAAMKTSNHYSSLFSTTFAGGTIQIKTRIEAIITQGIKQRGTLPILFVCIFTLLSGFIVQVKGSTSNALFPIFQITNQATIPDDYHTAFLSTSYDKLTLDYIAFLYEKQHLEKTKEKLAISMEDGTFALFDPNEYIPITPTTAGVNDWAIKLWIKVGDLWLCEYEQLDFQTVRETASDILFSIVSENWSDQKSFEKAARQAISKALEIKEELLYLDISELSGMS